MLEELKSISYIGSKKDVGFFIRNILNKDGINKNDIFMLCQRKPSEYQFVCEAFLLLFEKLDIISIDEQFVSFTNLGLELNLEDNNEILINIIIKKLIAFLFDNEVLTYKHFKYEVDENWLLFKNEYFPLKYSSIRNFLIECDFIKVKEKNQKIQYVVNSYYEELVEKQNKESKRRMSIDELKLILEKNELDGFKAECFVLEYEANRLNLLGDKRKPKQISEIDVSAGYDIVSYEDIFSSKYDRFIEVKSVNENNKFFWSVNEIEVSKDNGNKYYLYLVQLSRIKDKKYEPTIIKNPYMNVFSSSKWIKKAQSFQMIYIE